MSGSIQRVASVYRTSKEHPLLQEYGLEGLLTGEPVTLYHGTTHTFKVFDIHKSRKELVNEYYGVGLFFSPSRRVAEKYAMAPRNTFLPVTVLQDVAAVNPKAGEALHAMYKRGDAVWDEWTAEGFGVEPGDAYIEALSTHVGGVDANTLSDVAAWIEGTKTRNIHLGGDDLSVLMGSMPSATPNWVFQNLEELGVNSDTYKPKVYKVTVSGITNTLVTQSQSEARKARGKRYQGVVYDGPATVGGVPEVVLYDSRHIRIVSIDVLD